MFTIVRRWWPLVIFAVVAVANTDVVIVNQEWFREHSGLSLTGLAGLLVVVSVLELVYEYWFFGWCGTVAAQKAPSIWSKILDAIQQRARARDVERKLEGALTRADRTWNRLRDVAEVMTEGLDWRSHPIVKKGGYTALVVLTIPPLPGGRTVAVMLQRATHLPGGLVLIGVLSSVRTLYLLLGLNLVTRYVSLKTLIALALLAGTAWLWRKVRQKGRRREDRT